MKEIIMKIIRQIGQSREEKEQKQPIKEPPIKDKKVEKEKTNEEDNILDLDGIDEKIKEAEEYQKRDEKEGE